MQLLNRQEALYRAHKGSIYVRLPPRHSGLNSIIQIFRYNKCHGEYVHCPGPRRAVQVCQGAAVRTYATRGAVDANFATVIEFAVRSLLA
jgi:hypothetical protein